MGVSVNGSGVPKNDYVTAWWWKAVHIYGGVLERLVVEVAVWDMKGLGYVRVLDDR